MYAKNPVRFSVAAMALVALLAAVQRGEAQEQGWPFSHPSGWGGFPWNGSDYRGYDEPKYVTQKITPATPTLEPQMYGMNATHLPEVKHVEKSKAVTIVAHVPENAQIWIFDKLTSTTGKTRVFHSPDLDLGWKYTYTIRIAWVEDGKVVSQSQTFSVVPGEVHAVYLKRNETQKSAK